MLVKLSYFKASGKWYADGSYDTDKDNQMWQIWKEVAILKQDKLLPGLSTGHSDFTVLIDVPDHQYNHLHLIVGTA